MNPYGTGADGSVTISSNTTLTEDKNYVNLTINSGITLDTAGYTVKVRGTLLNNGIITSTNGAAGGSGGAGGAGGVDGGNGSVGGAPAGNGGGGGGGGGSGHDEITFYSLFTNINGPSGGVGGNGGKAGGAITILAKVLTNNGTIHTNGEAGTGAGNGGAGGYDVVGNPTTYWADVLAGGGGGGEGGHGGPGGTITLTYQTRTEGTVTANGGAGGAGGNGGNPGYAPGNNFGYCEYPPYNNPLAGVGGSGNGNAGAGGEGEYADFPDRGTEGGNGATGSTGSSGSISWTYAVAYEDSGIRYRHSGVTYKIGYEDLEATHKLRFRKGGVTVGLTLVATNDVDASPMRIYNGSAVKSLVKFT